MSSNTAVPPEGAEMKRTNVRWMIVALLFFVTNVNYGDRATLAIAGKPMSETLGFDAGELCWESVFISMGTVGILISLAWLKMVHDPKDHPKANKAEVRYIEEGGGLVNMDQAKKESGKSDHYKQVVRKHAFDTVSLGKKRSYGYTA
ncbi:hypothetical protein [Neisseria chenwenguii]|uniref:Uncharacterized protein n=1 Tax=Neisseria chenwenguii TaxID=1853278 RepID=A0A220S3T4_9NEIS|nr:hypothetical protein [Neisseria chenwenguii]ASK27993.1 hypothetical protein BG910_09870 [Neisseria chenwenguii]ROV54462.1 hypothetical protein EGS38_10835 [Neisseria chenwenguii]